MAKIKTDLILKILKFFVKKIPKRDVKNTMIKEQLVEILKEILKKNIKIGIVTNEPPAPNNPKSKPDKIKKIYPTIISI